MEGDFEVYGMAMALADDTEARNLLRQADRQVQAASQMGLRRKLRDGHEPGLVTVRALSRRRSRTKGGKADRQRRCVTRC
jgi:hypothetical protein